MKLTILALILFTVTLSACAQLALKLGVGAQSFRNAMADGVVHTLFAAALNPLIWTGILIYVLSVALWLWVLSKVDLSVAYPFVGVSFVLTMLFGGIFLSESITPMRIAGTLLIVAGCALVGRSA